MGGNLNSRLASYATECMSSGHELQKHSELLLMVILLMERKSRYGGQHEFSNKEKNLYMNKYIMQLINSYIELLHHIHLFCFMNNVKMFIKENLYA